MTPQEIFDHKNSWRPGVKIQIHSDCESRAREWCKTNLQTQQWHVLEYTDVYAHTFCFEHANHSVEFQREFTDWIQK